MQKLLKAFASMIYKPNLNSPEMKIAYCYLVNLAMINYGYV